MQFWISGIVLVCLSCLAFGEIFSSMADVEKLVSTEKELLRVVSQLQEQEKQKIAALKRYIDSFRRDHGSDITKNAAQIVLHPVRQFQLVKHITADWKDLREKIVKDHGQDAVNNIKVLQSTRKFPDEEDLKGTAEGFHRLQITYKIHPRSIAAGRIPGTRETAPFSAREAFLIGHKQAEDGFYNSAAVWLETAWDIYEKETEKTNDPVEILDWLQHAVWRDDRNVIKAIQVSEVIRSLNPAYSNLEDNLKLYRDVLKNSTPEEIARMENLTKVELDTKGSEYEELCRGEHDVAEEIRPYLQCYYETYDRPELLIQPVKMEVVHYSPDVFVIHDAILDSQSKKIRDVGHSHLMRARVIDKSREGRLSKTRVSKIAFLEEEVDPVIEAVNRYTGLASNLDHKRAEPLQINNYGIGGHYLSHWDFFGDPHGDGAHLIEPDRGDRIATFLMYMSDVEAGGATIFPKLNLTLFPERGTAAFWYNLHSDGNADMDTLHSGCPVLSGSKWVSNKWFRERGQDRRRPCGMESDSLGQHKEDYETVDDGFVFGDAKAA